MSHVVEVRVCKVVSGSCGRMCSTRSGVCVIVSDSFSLWKVHWSICWTVDPDKGEIYYIIFTQNRADNQAKGEEIQVSRCTRSSLHNRLTAIFGVLSKILDQKTSLLLDIVVGDFSLNHFFFFLNCTASRLHGNNYCCPSGDLLSIKVCGLGRRVNKMSRDSYIRL